MRVEELAQAMGIAERGGSAGNIVLSLEQR